MNSVIIMKNIGLALKNAREDLDMKQTEVMHKIGVNNKTLSGYENGVSEPDLETFARLVALYGLSADEILEIRSSQVGVDQREQQALRLFRKLSETQQIDILKMMAAII